MRQGPRRVAIVFSGGPAPAANAVISAAGISFLEDGREVVGIFHGYSNLADREVVSSGLEEGTHYRLFDEADLRGIRNSRGILIGTARTNPGRLIRGPQDLGDDERTEPLRTVLEGLRSLGVDALISIGGDDTLKTANLLFAYQESFPEDVPRIGVVHIPKTIDNDYRGIDFTFGFFTAVENMAKEVQNLRADARATSGWFVVETMGRKSGWLAYGVGVAGEASRVVGIEDVDSDWLDDNGALDPETFADALVDVVEAAERKGQHHGVIVLAEGLAERLPPQQLSGVERDEHGHISLGRLDLGKLMAHVMTQRYAVRTGRSKKFRGVQLGYESRCAPPHAFDVILGSQLGIGSFRALVERTLSGHMVSCSGQLDLEYVPFDTLVDPETLVTEVRFIERGSDFHKLARFLETRTEGRMPEPPRRIERLPERD